MADLFQELKQIVTRLEAGTIDYALCGGLALAVHGFPRATLDIDLLVPITAVQAVEAVAMSLGYTHRASDMTFADGAVHIRRLSRLDDQSGDVVTLDMLLVTPALAEVWADRLVVEWEDCPLRVVSAPGLVRLKHLRWSLQDQHDVALLEGRTHGED